MKIIPYLVLWLLIFPRASAVDFGKDVKPVLERRCAKCHAYGERKGGLSIETRESLLKGGEDGKVVEAGKTTGSLFLDLLVEKDSADRMPQKADKMPDDEIALLQAWVKEGLPWDEGFAFRHPKALMAPRVVQVPPARGEMKNPVDRLLKPYFVKQGVKHSKPVDDRVFLRRAYLDLIGLFPTPAQYSAFAEDKDPGKYNELADTLLANDEHYMQHWLSFWNDVFRNSYTRQYHGGNKYRLTNWLKASLKANKPYDQLAREVLSATAGDQAAFIDGIKWRGTVNSSQVVEMQAAQNVTQVFLGLNLKCASCHDSFINDWTLDQSYAFASVFANAPMEKHRCDKPTGKKVSAGFIYPELGEIDPKASRNVRLKQLAELMTKKENGRFSRVIVNRMWASFFGRGLVEPVDEMDNSPWSADLLDWLAHDFASNGHDLKHTMRMLVTSQAYRLPAIEPVPNQKPDEFIFKGPLTRRLRAEQFMDGLAQLGEAAAPPAKRPAFQRHGLKNLDRLMRILGRPKRDQVATSRDDRPTTLQALELSNGDIMHKAVQNVGNRWASGKRTPDKLIEDLFGNAFLRKPNAEETIVAKALLGEMPNAANVSDLVWALVLQPEFQLIY
ncbi:MAG: PSD1 and planctomycete cytochrome C domain-containing protein [Opitutales bacterium]